MKAEMNDYLASPEPLLAGSSIWPHRQRPLGGSSSLQRKVTGQASLVPISIFRAEEA